MTRCSYCNAAAENPAMFAVSIKNEEKQFYACCGKCTEKTKAFWRYALRTQILFWIGIASAVALCFVGFVNLSFTAIGLFILGITMILFPFATPETILSMGIKKSVLAVRLTALFVFFIAAVLWIAMS